MPTIELRIVFADSNVPAAKMANIVRRLVMDASASAGLPVAVVHAVTNKQVASGRHRPVCPKCNMEFHPERNGIGVLDMADFGPYAVWDADLWKCPGCGVEVVGGFGGNPISCHHSATFGRTVAAYRGGYGLIENKG